MVPQFASDDGRRLTQAELADNLDARLLSSKSLFGLKGLFFFVAALLILRSTATIPGLTPDSSHYLSVAESMLNGAGYVNFEYETPLTTYPPLFATLISLAGFFFHDIVDAARIVIALLFAINVLLAMRLLYLVTGVHLLQIIGGVLFLCAEDMIGVHSMVWSETVFITCVLLFCIYTVQFLSISNKRYFWLAAIAAAAGSMSRYVGTSLILAGSIMILLLLEAAWKERIKSAVLFVAVSSIPLAIWFMRNLAVSGRTYVSTGPSLEMFSFANLKLALVLIRAWTGSPPWVYSIVIVCILFAFFLYIRSERNENAIQNAIPLPNLIIVVVWIIAYLGTVFLSVYRYGLNYPADHRFLAPMFGPLVLLALAIAYMGVQKLTFSNSSTARLCIVIGILFAGALLTDAVANVRSARIIRILVEAFAAFFFIIAGLCLMKKKFNWLRTFSFCALIISGTAFILLMGRSAWIYSDPGIIRGYRMEEVKQFSHLVEEQSGSRHLYSNDNDKVYLLTRKKCYPLPKVYDLFGKGMRTPEFESRLREFRDRLRPSDQILYFDNSNKTFLPAKADLEAIGMVKMKEGKGITLYSLP